MPDTKPVSLDDRMKAALDVSAALRDYTGGVVTPFSPFGSLAEMQAAFEADKAQIRGPRYAMAEQFRPSWSPGEEDNRRDITPVRVWGVDEAGGMDRMCRVVVVPRMHSSTVEFRDAAGKLVGEIVNVGISKEAVDSIRRSVGREFSIGYEALDPEAMVRADKAKDAEEAKQIVDRVDRVIGDLGKTSYPDVDRLHEATRRAIAARAVHRAIR